MPTPNRGYSSFPAREDHGHDADVLVWLGADGQQGAAGPTGATGATGAAGGTDNTLLYMNNEAAAPGPQAVGALLAQTVFAFGADNNHNTTSSTTFVDVDATNLTVTFVAPPSGQVLVKLSALCNFNNTGTAGTGYWGLRSGGSDVANSTIYMADSTTGDTARRCNGEVGIGGLTPGTTYTWKWACRKAAGTATIKVYSGPTFGNAIMEVWDRGIAQGVGPPAPDNTLLYMNNEAAPLPPSRVLVASASRSSSNVTLNGTGWANVDTGLDLVVLAQAGDFIQVNISGRLAPGAGSTHTYFDVATIVSGSPVNYFGTAGGATDEGLNGWRCQDTTDARITGAVVRQLVSGDISAGTVTLRLRYRQDTAGNRAFVAQAVNPFKWWGINLSR